MLYWTIAQAPLRETPATGRKLMDLPFGALVEPSGGTKLMLGDAHPSLWWEVIYQSSTGERRGWIYAELIEIYINEFAKKVVNIPFPTPDPTDAAQYMIWLGNTQYNLCGELCICYICGEDIDMLLTKWRVQAISIFKRVFGNGRSRGTGLDDLDSMLAVYGYMPSARLTALLFDYILQRSLVSPGRMLTLLENYRAIVSVKINGATGNLQPSGILHWVVLEKVIPDGINRGWVELYNPFPNQMQRYSWNEFVASMGAPYGLWVKR